MDQEIVEWDRKAADICLSDGRVIRVERGSYLLAEFPYGEHGPILFVEKMAGSA